MSFKVQGVLSIEIKSKSSSNGYETTYFLSPSSAYLSVDRSNAIIYEAGCKEKQRVQQVKLVNNFLKLTLHAGLKSKEQYFLQLVTEQKPVELLLTENGTVIIGLTYPAPKL